MGFLSAVCGIIVGGYILGIWTACSAWTLIKQYKPLLVLLDVQMPGRTGREILGSIKGDLALKPARVILPTATAMQADVEAGITAGADFYLTKPFSPIDLLTHVEEALRLVEMRS